MRLRTWLRHLTTASIVVFLIAVAAIGYQRARDRNGVDSVAPDDVGFDVTDLAVGLYRGFQHTEILKGQPVFILNSLRTLSLASGWQEIEGVRLKFFRGGEDGPVLTAERASFNIETREARLTGSIHVEFPDGAFLNTETGEYDSKRQRFTSSAPVLYVDGPTFGQAMRASYSLKTDRVELEGSAGLRAEDGAMLVAPRMVYRRNERTVTFPEGVELTQGLSMMTAPRGVVRLSADDGPAEEIELTGGVDVTSVVQTTGAVVEIWGERVSSTKDPAGNWRVAVRTYGPWVDVRFTGGPDYFERRLRTTRVAAVVGPEGILSMSSDRGVCLDEIPIEGPPRSARAEAARAWFVGGQLTDVELQGNVHVTTDDLTGRGHRVRFIQQSGIVAFQGDPVGRQRVELESPRGRMSCNQAVLFDREQRIEARGQIHGELVNARLLGATESTDGDEPVRFAGNLLEVEEGGERLRLRDDARIWQGHRLLIADEVVYRHEAQEMEARGHVRATFPADQMGQPDGSGGDVVVVSRSLDYLAAGGQAVFRGAVHFSDPSHSLRSNRLTIRFDDNDEVTEVEAEGAVEIQDLEMGRRLSGNHAVRQVATQVVTVTGTPAQLSDSRGNVASGESLTWNQPDGTVSIGGGTELIYYPEEQP